MKWLVSLLLTFSSLFAHGLEVDRCPDTIYVDLIEIEARVHGAFKKNSTYKASVERLNAAARPLILGYKIELRGKNSCRYTSIDANPVGSALLYDKVVHDPEEPQPVVYPMLRASFQLAPQATEFVLYTPIESYDRSQINGAGSVRSLMARLPYPASEKLIDRQTGSVRFQLRASH